MVSRRTVFGVAAAAGIGLGLWAAAQPSSAQEKRGAGVAAPTLQLDSAILQADGDTLRALNVAGAGGKRIDITCKLAIEPDGTVRVADVSSAPSVFAPNTAVQLVPGRYVDQEKRVIVLKGPASATGGRQVFTAFTEDPRHEKFDGSWTTGPVAGHPSLEQGAAAKTLPPDFVYGTVTYGNGVTAVVGVRQVGNTIAVTVFDEVGKVFKPKHTVIFNGDAPPRATE